MQFGGNLRQVFLELTNGEETLWPECLDVNLPTKLRQLSSKTSVLSSPRQKRPEAPEARAHPPSDARAFKDALIKKFGTLARAWDAIDENCDGLLAFHEFIRACRSVQLSGNFKKVFQELTGGEDWLRPEAFDANLPTELIKLHAAKSG